MATHRPLRMRYNTWFQHSCTPCLAANHSMEGIPHTSGCTHYCRVLRGPHRLTGLSGGMVVHLIPSSSDARAPFQSKRTKLTQIAGARIVDFPLHLRGGCTSHHRTETSTRFEVVGMQQQVGKEGRPTPYSLFNVPGASCELVKFDAGAYKCTARSGPAKHCQPVCFCFY